MKASGWLAIGLAVFVTLAMIGAQRPPARVAPPANMPPMGATIPYSTVQSEPVPKAAATQTPWWRGGTLHAADPDTWNTAAHENKMATAADWLAALALKRQMNMHPSELEAPAADVVTCVDGALQPPVPPSADVRDMAAFCISTMASTRQFAQ
jgi:hypothetical protein